MMIKVIMKTSASELPLTNHHPQGMQGMLASPSVHLEVGCEGLDVLVYPEQHPPPPGRGYYTCRREEQPLLQPADLQPAGPSPGLLPMAHSALEASQAPKPRCWCQVGRGGPDKPLPHGTACRSLYLLGSRPCASSCPSHRSGEVGLKRPSNRPPASSRKKGPGEQSGGHLPSVTSCSGHGATTG